MGELLCLGVFMGGVVVPVGIVLGLVSVDGVDF